MRRLRGRWRRGRNSQRRSPGSGFKATLNRRGKSVQTTGTTSVKLKLIFVCLAIALVQITPSDAQSISPAGHYTYNRRGQLGEMRVQKVGADWRIFVIAAGAPRGPATAADCGLLAVGAIEGKTFQGALKYIFANK